MGGESVKTNSCMDRYLGTSSTDIVFTIVASGIIHSQFETRFKIAALKYGRPYTESSPNTEEGACCILKLIISYYEYLIFLSNQWL
jgi:hypothetical protein